jgi:hypothetical protein
MSEQPKIPVPGGMDDGNAFAILGKCHRAARRVGWTSARWEAFMERATSGDYDNLLRVVVADFDLDPDEGVVDDIEAEDDRRVRYGEAGLH